jgi:oligosaccharyltransferase complex subunit delta (ribophorin II)
MAQDMAKPPPSFPPSGTNPLKASLIIGSYAHTPVAWELFDLKVPASLPAPSLPEETSYHPLPTLSHTFQPDHKAPPRVISAFFSLLVLSPWLGLVVLVSTQQDI